MIKAFADARARRQRIQMQSDGRRIVIGLTDRGVRVEFLKQGLCFTGEDGILSKLLLSVLGHLGVRAVVDLGTEAEGIAIAKARADTRDVSQASAPSARQSCKDGWPVVRARQVWLVSSV